ncbi:DNA-binding response regulator [Xylanibacillus composti]|uniref:Putative transcriptional regulatory protein YkoG n=1 Tax=Xylanibacillus composti TaxID=1572762 RepID=A0A8J4H453_9BACL|nr:response regulator transcription factor [Xylanibacillus composti]MDT9725809.1 DNA-binding response regulator [Xylanibacillus composti]GIQ69236.1 putative transcriptional regulatory protein YkoG [Xylanibacillus composti]
MDAHILIIEDEEQIARVLMLELEHEGYQATLAADGRSGLELALSGRQWDLILLDIMLPELSGIEVLRRIRQAGLRVPVILLTARDSVPDIVNGLDRGANDYVTKPFAIEVLLARIRNLIQAFREQADSSVVLQVADLVVDLAQRRVERDSTPIALTPKEFELLLHLLRHEDEPQSREQIIQDVWGYDYVGDTNIVDVYIRYLRQKLDRHFHPKLIHTCRGVGYMLSTRAEGP